MSAPRTTYRLSTSAGVRCATAVSLPDGRVLAVPQKKFYDSTDSWKAVVEEEIGAQLTLTSETIAKELWNRPLPLIPGYNAAKKLKAKYETLNDDQRLILSLAHKHCLKECLDRHGFSKPTRIYIQTSSDGGFSIAPVHFNRWGRLKVAYKDVNELPRYSGTLILLLEESGVYKQIACFPSQELPPVGVPVIIIESKVNYFYPKVEEDIKKLVNAGYHVEIILGARRPNLGTNKRLAELYRRAEHKFSAPSYSSFANSLRSHYNNQTVEEYLAAPWTLAEVDGQDWFKGDIICSRLKNSTDSWKIEIRALELAEASVWDK